MPPASATANSTHEGNCSFLVADTAPPYTATIYTNMLVYSTTAGDNPVSATVTCEFRLGATVTGSAEFSGTGLVVGQKSVPFTNWVGQVFCTTVDYTSDDTPTETVCDPPPTIDTLLCPVLTALAPGVGNVVKIDEEGDVAVGNLPVWDCPPYES
jgi:hypothetical protein